MPEIQSQPTSRQAIIKSSAYAIITPYNEINFIKKKKPVKMKI